MKHKHVLNAIFNISAETMKTVNKMIALQKPRKIAIHARKCSKGEGYDRSIHLMDYKNWGYNVVKTLRDQVTHHYVSTPIQYEPRSEKAGLRDFRPGPTQTRLYNHTRWLEA